MTPTLACQQFSEILSLYGRINENDKESYLILHGNHLKFTLVISFYFIQVCLQHIRVLAVISNALANMEMRTCPKHLDRNKQLSMMKLSREKKEEERVNIMI